MWDWLGEPLAADFANTTKRRGMEEREYLRSGADLAEWARRQHGRVPLVPEDVALDEALALRAAVKRVLHAAVAGSRPAGHGDRAGQRRRPGRAARRPAPRRAGRARAGGRRRPARRAARAGRGIGHGARGTRHRLLRRARLRAVLRLRSSQPEVVLQPLRHAGAGRPPRRPRLTCSTEWFINRRDDDARRAPSPPSPTPPGGRSSRGSRRARPPSTSSPSRSR